MFKQRKLLDAIRDCILENDHRTLYECMTLHIWGRNGGHIDDHRTLYVCMTLHIRGRNGGHIDDSAYNHRLCLLFCRCGKTMRRDVCFGQGRKVKLQNIWPDNFCFSFDWRYMNCPSSVSQLMAVFFAAPRAHCYCVEEEAYWSF